MDDVHGRSRAIHVQDTVTLFRRCCGTTDQKPAIEPRRNLAVAVDIHRAAILHSNGRLPVSADQRDSGVDLIIDAEQVQGRSRPTDRNIACAASLGRGQELSRFKRTAIRDVQRTVPEPPDVTSRSPFSTKMLRLDRVPPSSTVTEPLPPPASN